MSGKKLKSSEEHVVYRSLREVIKIWAEGSGKANFSLDVIKDTAELTIKISFRAYATPSQQHIIDDVTNDVSVVKSQKKKSPSQRRRDRKRAMDFQHKKSLIHRDVRLPFSGKILPVNQGIEQLDTEDSSNVECEAELLNTPSQLFLPTPQKQAPMKNSQVIDNLSTASVLPAKKKLFPLDSKGAPTDNGDMLDDALSSTQSSYQRKESDLWTKIFT